MAIYYIPKKDTKNVTSILSENNKLISIDIGLKKITDI